MPDIFGMNYNGVQPRPTYDELINFVDYPVKHPDKSATYTRDSPLLNQFDGICMLGMEAQARRDIIGRQHEDMIRHITSDTGASAQLLSAFNNKTSNIPTESLADSRTQDVDELIADHVHDLEEEQRKVHDKRLRVMMEDIDREMFTTSDDAFFNWLMSLQIYALLQLACFNLPQLDLAIYSDHHHHHQQDSDNLSQLELVIFPRPTSPSPLPKHTSHENRVGETA